MAAAAAAAAAALLSSFSVCSLIACLFGYPLAGAEVKPGKPYTHTHIPRLGRLRLTQVRFPSRFLALSPFRCAPC
jgi:hypothetical protein